MITSKSPNQVAALSYAVAKQALPVYSHKFSPKKFTQPQLAACLVLREFFKKDYRGIVAILKDSSDLQKILELHHIPHFTTLQKASRSILKKATIRKLMASILTLATNVQLMKGSVSTSALDGTGFESHHVSHYFVQRRDRQTQDKLQTTIYRTFPKVGIICDVSNHLVICGIPERGPRFDRTHFAPALKEAAKFKPIRRLLADAGYDGESHHTHARLCYHLSTIIPATMGRQTDKLPTGYYRRLMRLHFPKQIYGQRWQVETVISMLKRNLGSALRARAYWSQCREILLRLFTHNIMVVLPVRN